MSWKTHTHKISNKISRSLGIINSLKNTFPRTILLTLYNSLILPHLQYSILCWGFNTGRVSTLQKRAIRIITRSKYNSHTEPIFKQLGLLKLEDIFHLSLLKFYYKLQKNTLPHYLQNMINENAPQHSYNTRNRSSSLPTSVRVSSSKCVRLYMPRFIDKTPILITQKTETHSPKGFSNYAKIYYLGLYKTECLIENCYICNR